MGFEAREFLKNYVGKTINFKSKNNRARFFIDDSNNNDLSQILFEKHFAEINFQADDDFLFSKEE